MFTIELQELKERVCQSIAKQVGEKGTASEFMSKMAIQVDDERSFNLDGNRWLKEVTQHELLDNRGYHYSFNVLSIDDLCDLADFIENL